MLTSLLGFFSLMVTTLTAVVALLINFSGNTSFLERGHYPRPIIVQSIAADGTAPWRSSTAKEASPAKDDVSSVKQHKPKALARDRSNNYGYVNAGYGNAYAYRYDPRGFFIH